MRPRLLHRGMTVLDAGGAVLGRVEGSFPLDGGGEADLAVVRLRRFGESMKLLPVSAARYDAGAVQLPVTAARVDDAPSYDPARGAADQAAHARFFWGEHAGDDAGRLGYARLAALRD